MILTLFESVQKAYTRPTQILNNTWDDIAEFLTTFNQCDKKEDMTLFNLWQFDINGEPGRKYTYVNGERTENYTEVPGTIRRCKANAQGAWGLILDYDGNKRIEEVLDELKHLEYVLYTTFRHSAETHKFRVVLPFSKACERDKFRLKIKSISETFTAVDHASFSESQSFYLHSAINDDEAIAYRNKGMMLDADMFADEIIPDAPTIELPKRDYDGDSNVYKEMLIESLTTCSGMHYAGVGTNHGVLTLVALCKSAGITYAEFDTICWKIAASDSSLQDAKQRKSVWNAWAPFNGITAKVREEFISCYGGVSKFGQKQLPNKQRSSADIAEYIKKKYMNKEQE